MAGEGFSCSRLVWLATVVVMAGILLFSGEKAVVRAQRNCRGDLEGLARECQKYVKKNGSPGDPSSKCCAIWKDADVECVCGLIPPWVANTISNAKVTFVAQFCGNPLPLGFKCVKEI